MNTEVTVDNGAGPERPIVLRIIRGKRNFAVFLTQEEALQISASLRRRAFLEPRIVERFEVEKGAKV